MMLIFMTFLIMRVHVISDNWHWEMCIFSNSGLQIEMSQYYRQDQFTINVAEYEFIGEV